MFQAGGLLVLPQSIPLWKLLDLPASFCPRLGIISASSCFLAGRNESALTQLLSWWSSCDQSWSAVKTKSMHLISSPWGSLDAPAFRKMPTLYISLRSLIFAQL